MAAVQIKTDISLDEYEFVDTDGKVLFSITFNASDVNLARRYDEMVRHMDELNTDQTEEDTSEALAKAEKEIGERMDKLLGHPVSEQIFSVMSPFTPLKNGKLYIEEVVEKIGAVIESETGKRLKKVQNRMGKYTAKYRK